MEPRHQLELRPVGSIELVVVHWSAGWYGPGYDPVEAYRREAIEHIWRDWSEEAGHQGGYGLMYHERIDRRGGIWLTRPANHVAWACRGANHRAYNVCLDAGPYVGSTTTQLSALAARVGFLVGLFGLTQLEVWGHGELVAYGNTTDCPGSVIREFCRQYRRRGGR